MIYLESPSTDPQFNLALEQFIFDEMDRSQEYFMLWQNDNAIIVGKNQNTIEEINQTYVEEHQIKVVRRLSGGGAVYHDLGNLNFTFIVNGEEASNMDLHAFCRPIARALNQLGVPAKVNGRNDITIEGRKFSGNSQYIRSKRIMHHGTMMFDSDLSVLAACLNVSRDKIESKGVKSVRSRVTNIREYLDKEITLEQYKELLLRFMQEEMPMERRAFTRQELARAEEIKAARYARWEWNYGYSPRYRLRKERRIEGCGKILVSMDVENGCIKALEFYGDYFGSGDTAELAALLTGCEIEQESLLTRMEGVDIERYFNHLEKEQFIKLLLQ